jgi:enoyl-CoA hydratase/3-hydroxyacyl-CoA dehydrogenase
LSFVNLEVTEGVATVTIQRPATSNSINPVVVHQLRLAFEQALADANVRGIVLAGAGKSFMVGADIDFFLRHIENRAWDRIVQFTEAGQNLLNLIDQSPKPVVARVAGAAAGAGFEFALACDRVIAESRATFSFPETSLGIYPGMGGTQRTPRAIGAGLAKWLIFTGRTLSASEARQLRIADEVVQLDQLENAAREAALRSLSPRPEPSLDVELTQIDSFFSRNRVVDLRTGAADSQGHRALESAMKSIRGKAPVALALVERLVDEGSPRSLEEGLRMELDHIAEIFATEDALLGLMFRAQKRLGLPSFVGR